VKEWFSSEYNPRALSVYPVAIFGGNDANLIFGKERLHVPVSEHLHELLREPMSGSIKDPDKYDKLFDRFEFLLALLHADLERQEVIARTGQLPQRIWGPVGRFGYRLRHFGKSILEDFKREFELTEQETGSPLQAGLFGGSVDRYRIVHDGIVELVGHSGYL
jgi:hypothetical protein